MESFPIQEIDPRDTFPQLFETPEPPKQLWMRGSLERTLGTKFVTIVGSRNHSSYGKQVCESIVRALAGYPITIVSGLAIGIDAVAHRTALEVGLPTIAFPGSGLGWRVLYPAQHRGLAEEILASGGALISEYPEDTKSAIWTFPRRNRLEAGISQVTIIIEAEEKSGTLITARLATEYNKTVCAVPGPITSPTSKGTNWLIRLGATPITTTDDVIQELGFATRPTDDASMYLMLTEDETLVLGALNEPKSRDTIAEELGIDPIALTVTISTLEIKGAIRESMGRIERIV